MIDINCLTIDLEPWMCIHNNPKLTKELDNNLTPQTTQQILDLLDKYNTKATFFILGKIHEWYPELIKEISNVGHEISLHTYTHRKITSIKVLEEELHLAKEFIEKYKPKGFRAPQLTLPNSLIPILRKWNFAYDSSMYSPLGKPFVYKGIIEVPVTTYPLIYKDEKTVMNLPRTLFHAIRNLEIPFGSGLFISLLNSRLLSHLIKSCNKNDKSVVLFIHPWQLVIGEIRKMKIPIRELITKLPYMIQIKEEKLENLLKQHYFTSIEELLREYQL